MDYFRYKRLLFCGAIFAAAALVAEEMEEDEEKRLVQLETEMREISIQNASGEVGALFAPYLDPAKYGWSFDIEPLLWHAKVGSFDWAILYDQSVYPADGDMYTLGFGWDGGVRVGMTKTFKDDALDVGLFYNYFSTHDSSTINIAFQTPAGTGGSASLQSPFGTSYGTFAAKLVYNALDLAFGRSYFVSKDLMMHPHLGLKSIWLSQKYTLLTHNFIDATNSILAVAGTVATALQANNVVWGMGPHIGVDSSWDVRYGLKFISSAEVALLQSYVNVTQAETIDVTPLDDVAVHTTINLRAPIHQLTPYGRLMFGIGWGGMLPDKKRHLDVSFAYEANYFWRINQALNDQTADPSVVGFTPTESTRILFFQSGEDVCFYGFTGRIKLDF